MSSAEAALLSMILLAAPLQAPDGDAPKVKVTFQSIDFEVFAQQVEQVTRKTFLYQDQLLKGKKLTLQSESPLGPKELYKLFQTVCHMHGFALIPAKVDGVDLVKIVQTSQGPKEPGEQPILSQGEPLPSGDALIYYLISPKHISTPKALTVLSTAISGSGIIQQIPGSDRILVIDVATAVARAEKLLSLVDVQAPAPHTETVALRHLPVAQAKARLSEFVQSLYRTAAGEPGAGRMIIIPDDRLNTLDLIGPEDEVRRSEEFLARIDQELPPARRTIQYYKLKNVAVLDIVDSVRQVLGLAISARAGSIPSSSGQSDSSKLPAGPKPAVEAPKEAAEGSAKPPSSGVPKGASLGSALPADVEVVPLVQLNTLVVVGNPFVHEEVRGILENLDRRKAQVLIEVAIIQVTGDDQLDAGIEVLLEDTRNNGAIASGGTGFGLATQSPSSGSGFPTEHTLQGFTGGAFRYIKPDEISVLLRALATHSNVNIMSQPLLLVNDNEEATFSTKVSEPTIAISQGSVTTTTSFAGFAEAVTSLRIQPQISPGGYLNLKVTQNFEEFTGSATTTGVPPPKVSNNVATFITIPDRHTAIMGGFTRDSATESVTGLPIIRDVPLLNLVTSRRTTRITKSRLYLFVRPRILSTEGFSDLMQSSRERAGNVRQFTRGSKIDEAVRRGLEPDPGSEVKEAPLPFGEKP